MITPHTPGGLSVHEVCVLVPEAASAWRAEYERICAADPHCSLDARAEADRRIVGHFGDVADRRQAEALAALPPTEIR